MTSKAAITSLILSCWVLAFLTQTMPVFGIGGSVDTKNAWKTCLLKPSRRPEGFIVSITFGVILPIVLEGLLYGSMFAIFFTQRFRRIAEVNPSGDPTSVAMKTAEVTRINNRLKVAKTLSLGFVITCSCSLSTPIIAAVYPQYVNYPLLLLFLRVILVAGYAIHPVSIFHSRLSKPRIIPIIGESVLNYSSGLY